MVNAENLTLVWNQHLNKFEDYFSDEEQQNLNYWFQEMKTEVTALPLAPDHAELTTTPEAAIWLGLHWGQIQVILLLETKEQGQTSLDVWAGREIDSENNTGGWGEHWGSERGSWQQIKNKVITFNELMVEHKN